MLVTNGPASLGASTLFTLEDDLMFALGSDEQTFDADEQVLGRGRSD